jgi:hypothetical protein
MRKSVKKRRSRIISLTTFLTSTSRAYKLVPSIQSVPWEAKAYGTNEAHVRKATPIPIEKVPSTEAKTQARYTLATIA